MTVTPRSISDRSQRSRSRLANYLRDIADAIERDELETAPWAATLVLTGDERHEVLAVGYGSLAEMPFKPAPGEGPMIKRTEVERQSSAEPHPDKWHSIPTQE